MLLSETSRTGMPRDPGWRTTPLWSGGSCARPGSSKGCVPGPREQGKSARDRGIFQEREVRPGHRSPGKRDLGVRRKEQILSWATGSLRHRAQAD